MAERPVVITVAASDPILLAVAPGALALTSGDRATRRTSTVDSGWTERPVAIMVAASDPIPLADAPARSR